MRRSVYMFNWNVRQHVRQLLLPQQRRHRSVSLHQFTYLYMPYIASTNSFFLQYRVTITSGRKVHVWLSNDCILKLCKSNFCFGVDVDVNEMNNIVGWKPALRGLLIIAQYAPKCIKWCEISTNFITIKTLFEYCTGYAVGDELTLIESL